MSITENIMVELRQLANDSQNSGAAELNGEFDITLPERITIKENDVVSIESVFIDDEGEDEGKIILENDVNGFISFNMYLTDCNPSQYYATPSVPITSFRSFSDAVGNHPDGQKYYLSSLDDAQSSGLARKMSSFTFETHQKLDTGKNESTIKLVFSLNQPSGAVREYSISFLPKHLTEFRRVDPNDKKNERTIYTVNQVVLDQAQDPAFGKTSFSFPFLIQNLNNPPKMIVSTVAGQPSSFPMYPADEQFGLERDSMKYGVLDAVDNSHHVSIRERHVYFSLEQGKYDPDDLARRITDQITSPFNKQGSDGKAITKGFIGRTAPIGGHREFEHFTENEAFTTAERLYSFGSDFDGNDPNVAPLWVREDGAKFCQMTEDFPNLNQWCGASNFGLTFNGVDRFEFTNLHNSQYSGGTETSAGVKVVRGHNIGNDVTKDQFIANSHSGLAISILDPPSLWVDKLGFTADVAYSSVVYKTGTGITFTTAGGQVITPSVETMDHLVEGINFTGDLASTDTLNFKSDKKDAAHGYCYDLVGTAISGVSTAIVNTYPVVGNNIAQGVKQANGYYLVEVDGGFPSKLIGHDKATNKVQAVVGRYYSGNTYTQSTGGEGAIVYQHKGNPIQLSNLKCRITLPDGSLPNLGPDNTIFLKITKGK